MKKLLRLLAVSLILNAGSAVAEQAAAAREKQSNIVVHIDSVEYTNPIRLWHPYIDYWYFQGPMFEDHVRSCAIRQSVALVKT